MDRSKVAVTVSEAFVVALWPALVHPAGGRRLGQRELHVAVHGAVRPVLVPVHQLWDEVRSESDEKSLQQRKI